MKVLDSLKGGTAMEEKNLQFTGCEAESGQTTKKLRCRIAGLNPKAGIRITPVSLAIPQKITL